MAHIVFDGLNRYNFQLYSLKVVDEFENWYLIAFYFSNKIRHRLFSNVLCYVQCDINCLIIKIILNDKNIN